MLNIILQNEYKLKLGFYLDVNNLEIECGFYLDAIKSGNK